MNESSSVHTSFGLNSSTVKRVTLNSHENHDDSGELINTNQEEIARKVRVKFHGFKSFKILH